MLEEFETENSQPDFAFKVDTSRVPLTDIQWFIRTMEDRVARGESFRTNETIQVGWGLLKTRETGDGKLRLLEPDFASLPIEWVETVTQTLLDLRVQKDVSESYFAVDELLFPSLRESAVVCKRLRGSLGITMERLQAESPDSGWFIGCANDDHEHNDPQELERASLYEAVLRNPLARMFLALPFGTLLQAAERDIRMYRFDSPIEPKDDSFVQKLLARR